MRYIVLLLTFLASSAAAVENFDVKYQLLATFEKNNHSLKIKVFSTAKECKDAKSFIYFYVKDHNVYSEMTLDYKVALSKLKSCVKRLSTPVIETQQLSKFIQGNEYSSTDVSCAGRIPEYERTIQRNRKQIKILEEKRKIDTDYPTNFTPNDLNYTCIPIID